MPALQKPRQTYPETECCTISDINGVSRGRGNGCPNSALKGMIKKAPMEKWLCPMLPKAQHRPSFAGTYILKAKPFKKKLVDAVHLCTFNIPSKGLIHRKGSIDVCGLNHKYLSF